jgi:hypothetical protein
MPEKLRVLDVVCGRLVDTRVAEGDSTVNWTRVYGGVSGEPPAFNAESVEEMFVTANFDDHRHTRGRWGSRTQWTGSLEARR